MSMRIFGLQQAQDAIKKELSKLGGLKVATVGIHEDAGAVPDGAMSMATLGAIQHFGNDRIPARRWLDVGVESGTSEYLAIIQEGIAAGLTEDKILEQIGAVAQGVTQEYIRDLKDPPNAPSTIKKKGSDNPLVDTGALMQSVTYKVQNKMPEEGL